MKAFVDPRQKDVETVRVLQCRGHWMESQETWLPLLSRLHAGLGQGASFCSLSNPFCLASFDCQPFGAGTISGVLCSVVAPILVVASEWKTPVLFTDLHRGGP